MRCTAKIRSVLKDEVMKGYVPVDAVAGAGD